MQTSGALGISRVVVYPTCPANGFPGNPADASSHSQIRRISATNGLGGFRGLVRDRTRVGAEKSEEPATRVGALSAPVNRDAEALRSGARTWRDRGGTRAPGSGTPALRCAKPPRRG